jgi:hypothetical protein
MAIKDILLPLVSYPNPTTNVAIEKCVAIAGYMGANISATAVELEVPAPGDRSRGPLSWKVPLRLRRPVNIKKAC